eukprot:NODE_10087_length_346_cov_47.515152_g9178_i0.p1 GENE.NODE_10087_length_346_cov_47.515152_g9178_i0~~NODE_10087_length_346_cov_47.515152_g9178_i0.p1  ORF type:complete len:92 (+),score=37.29 NODE_10087_length_346_cov_47.515152_g9178_i0:25-276(+)
MGFRDNQIDGALLRTANNTLLKQLGVGSLRDRQVILDSIRQDMASISTEAAEEEKSEDEGFDEGTMMMLSRLRDQMAAFAEGI